MQPKPAVVPRKAPPEKFVRKGSSPQWLCYVTECLQCGRFYRLKWPAGVEKFEETDVVQRPSPVTRSTGSQAFLQETVRSAEQELRRYTRREPAKAELLIRTWTVTLIGTLARVSSGPTSLSINIYFGLAR